MRRRVQRWQRGVPRAFAWVLAATAALSAAAAVGFAFGARTQPVRAMIDTLLIPAPANLGYAVFVAILAASVTNRKRVAYWMLVAFFGLQVLGDALVVLAPHLPLLGRMDLWEDGHHLRWLGPRLTAGNMVLTGLVLVLLWLSYGEFYAKVQRASVTRALATLCGSLVGSVLIGWGLMELVPGSLRNSPDRFRWAAERVLGGAFTFNITHHARGPAWMNLVLGLFGAISLLAALGVLLRSQRAAARPDPDEERRIRALLAAHGERDSLGYFATRNDKKVIFSPSGKAAVTYRVVFGVTLASGDPIGDPEAWSPAIDAWLAEAREYAWTPAVIGASEAGATAYSRVGLRVIELGDEAILAARRFTLEGREMRQVRQAVQRVRRCGYEVRIRRHHQIPPGEMENIVELAGRWRDTGTERGFSMALGRLGEPGDGQCVLVTAFDRRGQTAAILSFVPWGTTGLSLDLMRRDRTSDNGLVEAMVAALMREAPRLGVERVSLNFAVFRSAFEEGARIGAGPVLRIWRKLLVFFSRWFQLESLYRSNVKYRPDWVPRFLCFEDVRDLAKVGLASGIAEGFVVLPRLPSLSRRGRGRRRAPEDGQRLPGPARSPVPGALAAPDDVSALAGVPVGAALTAARGGSASASSPASGSARRVTEQTAVRLAKVAAMRADGVDPYPPDFRRTHECGAIRDAYAGLPPEAATGDQVAVAGRVVLRRDHGGVYFATLRDFSGDLQVMLRADRIDEKALHAWRSSVDLGDHVGVTGEVVTSRRGTVSVLADQWVLTAKCLHPLPDKHRGLIDPEALVRSRHLDLIVNPAAREMLRVRSAVLQALRRVLVDRGFLEVETPILQPVHGGANARPFTTHSNAYDLPLYLRIAPELYLKRLAVGGVERVFELGRDFRNEGADATHNPEFTMLEAYQAYADYGTMRELARELVVAAGNAAYGAPQARRLGPDGATAVVDLSGRWPVVPVYEAVSAALGERVGADTDEGRLRVLAERANVPTDPAWSPGAVVLELYERLVEAVTVAPTFYVDFPVDVSPLTRAHRTDPRLAERWDLVAFGMELATAYTELVDPVEQRGRLTAQSLLAAGGDVEAMQLDEEFLGALEYAMPPTGGLGLGVDRLVMLLTGRTIRETLPFPLVKPGGEGGH